MARMGISGSGIELFPGLPNAVFQSNRLLVCLKSIRMLIESLSGVVSKSAAASLKGSAV
ncbi:hypothetical protein Patl1_25912 [Pistacia atlantica]|uniref:Uncharacterized protein n=1 Tax=Pistacia atlantica TaxID=434234 RepID=A0ACC1B4R2_9ROSI|nr:hypothetical protein Patl1_25912 [Pistacia atlantica]